MQPCDAIVFDLDGTLLDSLDDLADSLNHALAQVGLPVIERQRYRTLVGQGVESLVKNGIGPEHQALYEKTLALYREAYQARMEAKTRPYEGIEAMLARLQQGGWPMAILSNKPHQATVDVVARLLPGDCFALVRGHQPPMPLKPAPDGALAIAHALGIAPARCAFVGDTKVDIETALAAGMWAVGVTWGFRDRQELVEAGAAWIIDHPSQLVDRLMGPKA